MLLVWNHLPLVAAGDAGDDFTNNLFSDLAPLLAFFGEQVAKQYMSHSMGRLESFIFAMSPLGIITAVTGAIRVGGPTWLKALIGRAREGKGLVELEVMSSTSADVCEMWNDDSISRLLGSGQQTPIVEIFYYFDDDDDDFEGDNRGSASKARTLRRTGGQKLRAIWSVISRLFAAIKPSSAPVWHSKHTNGSEVPLQPLDDQSNQGSSWLFDLRSTIDNGVLEPCSCSSSLSSSNITISEFEGAPPNLGINFGRSRLTASELYGVAWIGFVLQASVVAFAGTVVLYFPWASSADFQKDGRSVPQFAFPVFAGGTVVVTIGTFLCAHIVERSMDERTWETNDTSAKGMKALWIQKKGNCKRSTVPLLQLSEKIV